MLPPQIAELIAAGEVIDRPASIVKELVENALDAGASRISVEIRGGGIGLIRVTDNGSGISREDLANAFIRHATSKVSSVDDLDAIGTLGFRGEALPSIAAVSHVKVITRTENEPIGSEFSISGTERGVLSEIGCSVGTTVEVRDVFYNTPARMKFLKKDTIEGGAVASLLDRLALANPKTSFEFVREGKRVLQTPGDGNLLTAVRIVCGNEIASNMVPVSYRESGISVEGYVSKPATCRSTRTLQIFYINTRYVRSRTCAAAVEDSYKNRLMVGRFPACVLNLTIDTSLVDVNVHPAKLEVRFSSERDVYNAVYAACMQALRSLEIRPAAVPPKKLTVFSLDDFDYSDQQTRLSAAVKSSEKTNAVPSALPKTTGSSLHSPRPLETAPALHTKALEKTETVDAAEKQPDIEKNSFSSSGGAVFAPASKKERAVLASPVRTYANIDIEVEPSSVREKIVPPPEDPVCEPDAPVWRIIGELFGTYILVEQGEEYHMIDKHAAHERFNYERLRRIGETPADRQVLISPEAVSLPREEYAILLEHPEALDTIGITAEDFGEGTLLVREIPMLLDGCSLGDLLSETAGKLLANRRSVTPAVLDELLYSVACRASVMAGKRSTAPELWTLADFVLGERQIRYCPHGRPAVVTMTRRDVEKLFGRLG